MKVPCYQLRRHDRYKRAREPLHSTPSLHIALPINMELARLRVRVRAVPGVDFPEYASANVCLCIGAWGFGDFVFAGCGVVY